MKAAHTRRSVFLIDDHPIVAAGLRIALMNVGGLRLVGSAGNPSDGLSQLEATQPDCVILDLVFSGVVELTLIQQCRALVPCAFIVVYSSLPARLYFRDALDAGANAYLTKEADVSELLALLSGVERVEGAKCESGLEAPRHTVVGGICLTPREAQVASRVGRGLSIATIARDLNMNPKTVAVHRDNIRRKLHCRDTNELVARLARIGLAN